MGSGRITPDDRPELCIGAVLECASCRKRTYSLGASGQIFTVQPASEGVAQEILERFRLDRDREYAEFKEQCQVLLAELEKESGNQKFTFAELEENEQNLQKLTGWLAKIQRRDFFGSAQSEMAAAELEKCRQAFEAYAAQVYAQDQLD